jgi:hypothetical protein
MDIYEHIKATRNTESMKAVGGVFKYNEGVRQAWTPIWTRNAARTYKEVERRFQIQDCDLRQLPRIDGQPVLALGSGPSLDDVLPYLKDWKGKLACSTSQLPLLKYMGIEPDYVFLIDADPTMVFLLKSFVEGNQKSILITHPQIPREIIELWPENRVYFFRMYDPGDKFSTDYIPLIYGWLNEQTNAHIGSYVLNSGNVINCVCPVMQALGAKIIFLAGYDLGYPDLPDKPGVPRHRSSYFGKATVFHQGDMDGLNLAPEMPTHEQRPIQYYPGANGVLSDELCYFYKYSFMILYGLSCVPVLSCSRGILEEVPYVNPKEVVEKQGVGFEGLLRTPQETYKIATMYLHYRKLYILKTDFWIETINLDTKKGFGKLWLIVRWHWLITRPWKWLGGRGYMPIKIRRMQRKAKKQGKDTSKLQVVSL